MMNEIDNILEKYFEGLTSLEEEKTLRQYFRQPEIEERHKMYAPMFNFFSEERKEISIEKKKRKIPLYAWVSIAASILLLITVKSIFFDMNEEVSKSLLYIDGKKITNTEAINSEALISIENVSQLDEDVIDSQISILDSFTE
ncbi:hypothetical protein [Prevotella sp. 10(H)]|uniref:hypothetical protein n=1 Tax=Prevotella sp. 10(H) TaxID=1158294 RepID=UPI0018CC465D|nr:hypothetical protein [Prevotella sp. 10(H)]